MSDQLIELPPIPTIDERILLNSDPVYASKICDLLTSLKGAKDIYELRRIFDEFAEKYLVLPQLWVYRKNLFSVYVLTTLCTNREEFNEINKKAYCNFYSPDIYTANGFTKYYNEMEAKIDDWQLTFPHWRWRYQFPCLNKNQIYHDLSFPHEKIAKTLEFYEAFGDQFLPHKFYLECKKTIKAYNILKDAIYDSEYFKAYIELGNDTVAIQCIEILIDRNPTCKWLWKSYLEFLKDRLPRVYLDVLQKYTNFFISDTSSLNFFRQECHRIHSTIPSITEQKSLKDFLFTTKISSKNYYFSEYRNPPLKNYGNHFNTFITQNFSLPSPIIWYMLSQGPAKYVNLLFQSCKHLFLLKKSPICCNLIVQNHFKTTVSPFNEQSIRIGNTLPPGMKKIFLAKTLTISCKRPKSLLSSIISRLSRCTIWYLHIVGQIVSWNELQFLLESGNVERFIFVNGKITVAGGKLVPMENVVEEMPKAHTVISDSVAFTSKTFSRLAVHEKPVKFKEFVIKNVTSEFKFKDFYEFVKNHSELKSKFTVWFEASTRINFFKDMQNLSKAMLKEWIPKKSKPSVSLRILHTSYYTKNTKVKNYEKWYFGEHILKTKRYWYLHIVGQIVSWNELQFLLESGNIERFIFANGKITVAGGKLIPMENVVEEMPKAHTVM